MNAPIISQLRLPDEPVEVVERKGLGHPDTICDALAETLSRALCREYRSRYGTILHHNVDKALLCAGRAAAAFGGGRVLDPMHIYLSGRATTEVKGDRIPLAEIAVESAKGWLKDNLHALDADHDVQVYPRIQPGSLDLQALFVRHRGTGMALANDTSIGVGHAPLSPLERLVLAVERRINGRDRAAQNPAWGEDVKVMGVRRHERVDLTVACAMIGRHLAHIDDYLAQKAAVADLVRSLAAEHGFAGCEVGVNLADNAATGSVYLTVTGTSAEAGDDGEVGRGNRINGLITPCRPMSLEAAAGKNPVSHVGKIYNIVAQQVANALIAASDEIVKAECLMVSKIGAPVTEPAVIHVRIATVDGAVSSSLRERVSQVVADRLHNVSGLIDDFLSGAIDAF